MRKPIAAVIFDYGEVIALNNAEDWQRMVALSTIPEPAFSEGYWRHRLDYDAGLSAETYWSRVGASAGVSFTPTRIVELIRADIAHWTHLDPRMLAWIEQLDLAGLEIGMISNMPASIGAVVRTLPFASRFDSIVYSCDLGVVKPEPLIYETALKQLNVAPSAALFLDDKAINAEGARACGMHAIVYHGFSSLAEQIADYDLPLRC